MVMTTVVLYHGNCLDGTGAKYAAWKKLGDRATYIPVQYGNNSIPPEVENSAGLTVFVLDFSYPKDILLSLRAKHKSVTVIDHHKTAEADLIGMPDCVFDMTKSGAVLAWEYFHGKKKIPAILLHVQDRDLWQWKLAKTKEITTGLSTLNGSVLLWDSTLINDLLAVGEVLCEYTDSKVDSTTKPDRVRKVTMLFKGRPYMVGILNVTENVSEINQAMYTKDPSLDFTMTYFIGPHNDVVMSFRSDGSKENAFDVSALAKVFGGGGHHTAAGGRTSLTILEKILNGSKDLAL
jgi:oligoribonuclease NrnB/cAMP/cGMP phosphodiesterase (DHH superfamily)